MKRIAKLISLLLILAMALSLAACSNSKSKDPYSLIPESTQGKDVTRNAGADNVFSLNCNMNYSFNPLIATNRSNQLVCSLVYENMVEVDNNFEAIPNVLTDWSCTEDAKTWYFTIDEGHTFHDGTPSPARTSAIPWSGPSIPTGTGAASPAIRAPATRATSSPSPWALGTASLSSC